MPSMFSNNASRCNHLRFCEDLEGKVAAGMKVCRRGAVVVVKHDQRIFSEIWKQVLKSNINLT